MITLNNLTKPATDIPETVVDNTHTNTHFECKICGLVCHKAPNNIFWDNGVSKYTYHYVAGWIEHWKQKHIFEYSVLTHRNLSTDRSVG